MSTEIDRRVEEAIEQARSAAAQAGFGAARRTGIEEDAASLAQSQPKISYAFELSGFEDAPQVAEIEHSLEEIPGVRARIVYTTALAWITAPDGLDPAVLAEVFEAHGVKAVMTDASLQRRALHNPGTEPSGEGRRRRARARRLGRGVGRVGRTRQQLEAEERALARARSAGFLDRSEFDARFDAEFAAAEHSSPVRHRIQNHDVLYTARDLITTARVVVAVLFGLPVVVLTYASALQFSGWQWVCLALATPVVLWCAWPFHRAMVGGVRRGVTALDGASSVAIAAAYIWSLVMLVVTDVGVIGWHNSPSLLSGLTTYQLGGKELFLDVACGMTVLLLVGRKTSIQVRSSLIDDLDNERVNPQTLVTVVSRSRSTGESVEHQEPLSEINVGDDILIGPGDRIPVDGTVIGGGSEVAPGIVSLTTHQASGTTRVQVDDYVVAGSLNLSSRIKVRVQRTGHRTRQAAVRRWVALVNRRQNEATMLSTSTASWLIPGAFVLALCGFAVWFGITRNLSLAFGSALAVLACVAPTALALSSALALRLGIESAARHGLMLRNGKVLRNLENVDTVIFNRVGTLAEPDMTVETVTADRGEDADLVLRVAGAVALESDHPLSQAIVHAAREARDRGTGGDGVPHWIDVHWVEVDDEGAFNASVDIPVKDKDGQWHPRQTKAKLWRPQTLSDLKGRLAAAATGSGGGTPIVVQWGGRDRGVITLHDTVKEDASDAVDRLSDLGLETTMLSRDVYPVARRLADRIGLSSVLAGIAPGKKAMAVRAAYARGARIAMVGDASVTDCLTVANVGILVAPHIPLKAMSHGKHRGADVVMLRRDVSAVPDLFDLGRKVCRAVDRNIYFAWAYNGIAVTLALLGLIHPMVATVLMLAASVVVELGSNSVRKALD